MTLAEKLASTPQRSTGKPCSVGALEDFLAGKEADAFHAMMHTLGWSGARVWVAVQNEAKELRAKAKAIRETEGGNLAKAEALETAATVHAAMSDQQVNRHRSRACRCFKQVSA